MTDKIEKARLALEQANGRVQIAMHAYDAAVIELRNARQALNEADRAHLRTMLEAELNK